MRNKKWCFVGIGSNIRPKTNIPQILQALRQRTDSLHISRIVQTEAVEMLDNTQSFFNLSAAFETELNSAELKRWFQEIETTLGRDRNHPQSKMLGRPADIDEIELPLGTLSLDMLPPEPHVRPMLLELLAFLGIAHFPNPMLAKGEKLQLDNRDIGQQAMTIQ